MAAIVDVVRYDDGKEILMGRLDENGIYEAVGTYDMRPSKRPEALTGKVFSLINGKYVLIGEVNRKGQYYDCLPKTDRIEIAQEWINRSSQKYAKVSAEYEVEIKHKGDLENLSIFNKNRRSEN